VRSNELDKCLSQVTLARFSLIDRSKTDVEDQRATDRNTAERAALTEVSAVARTTRCFPRGGQCSLSLSLPFLSLSLSLSSRRALHPLVNVKISLCPYLLSSWWTPRYILPPPSPSLLVSQCRLLYVPDYALRRS